MAQYVYTMRRVSKTVPPKRTILKNISLNFFPGAKIGVLGLNGSGKSTLLRIMAGVDDNYEGEVVRMPGIKVGYLEQEPLLKKGISVRDAVEGALGDTAAAKKRLEEVYAAYAEPDADFDKLAEEQARLEALINAGGADELEVAADALRLPPWEQKVDVLSGGVDNDNAIGFGVAVRSRRSNAREDQQERRKSNESTDSAHQMNCSRERNDTEACQEV